MDSDKYYAYVNAMPEIEAQERLALLDIAIYPKLKPDARKNMVESLNRLTTNTKRNSPKKGRPLSPDEIMAAINGPMNGR